MTSARPKIRREQKECKGSRHLECKPLQRAKTPRKGRGNGDGEGLSKRSRERENGLRFSMRFHWNIEACVYSTVHSSRVNAPHDLDGITSLSPSPDLRARRYGEGEAFLCRHHSNLVHLRNQLQRLDGGQAVRHKGDDNMTTVEPNQIKPNETKKHHTNRNRTKPNQTKPKTSQKELKTHRTKANKNKNDKPIDRSVRCELVRHR